MPRGSVQCKLLKAADPFSSPVAAMSGNRTRFIFQEWARDPKGVILRKEECPSGIRPANNMIWGHDLDDFFWIQRIPGINVITCWSRSMIKELGESKLADDGDFFSCKPGPRRRRIWPVLELPKNIQTDLPLGVIDEGSDHDEDCAYQTLPDSWESDDEHRPLPSDGSPGTSSFQKQNDDDVHKSSDATSPGTAPNPHTIDPFILDGIPKLEEFIPRQYFPAILMVHDPRNVCAGSSFKTKPANPKRYRRIFPIPDSAIGSTPPTSTPDNPTSPTSHIAHLYVPGNAVIGEGNHSLVYRASILLPYPLGARSTNKQVTVAMKIAYTRESARELLDNEAKMYSAFPQHLMEEWCGYNLVTPIKYPVPVASVVPKFYGYYVPDFASHSDEDEMEEWKKDSPILLLEDCGAPIEPAKLSVDERTECYSMFVRLHYEGFLQNSCASRNILMQPGPLTVPPNRRSIDKRSFRVIDFGRAVRLQDTPENRVVDPSPNTSIPRPLSQPEWYNDRDRERRRALELLGFDPVSF